MSGHTLLSIAEGCLIAAACAVWARRQTGKMRRAEQLYGRSRGLHIRRTRTRVPGMPRDGHKLSEAALAEIESRARSRTT